MAKKAKPKSHNPIASGEYSVNHTVAKHAEAKQLSSKPVAATTQTAKPDTKPKKHSNKRKIAAVVLLIILLSLLYLYLTYGSLPSALIAASLSGKPLSASAIEAIVLQKLDTNNMVGLTYSGTAMVNTTFPSLQIEFTKYFNDTRTSLTLTQFPSIKNINLIAIGIDNGATGYSCESTWNSNETQNSTYACKAANNNETNGVVEAALNRITNISTISNLHVNSYGISTWNWQPCYSVSGEGSIMVNGTLVNQTGYIPSSLNFTSCVSAEYDIPLTLKGVISLGDSRFVNFSIQESSMNSSATLAQITSLPQQG